MWFLHRSAPTPLIMHTVKDKELHLGIEITASHNSSNYNGIKLIVDEGMDAHDFAGAVADGRIVYLHSLFNKFMDDIIELLDMKALWDRGLRVLFDTMHGSGTYPLQGIFIRHVAQLTPLM